jgi:hypothetical protein
VGLAGCPGQFSTGTRTGHAAGAARSHGLLCAALGRCDEALHHIEAAQRIDPFSCRQKIALAKFLYISYILRSAMKKPSGGFRHRGFMDHFPIHGPRPVETRLQLALIFAKAEDYQSVRRLVETVRPEAGGRAALMAEIGEIIALCGDRDQAVRIAVDFKLFTAEVAISQYRKARFALALDDPDVLSRFFGSPPGNADPKCSGSPPIPGSTRFVANPGSFRYRNRLFPHDLVRSGV